MGREQVACDVTDAGEKFLIQVKGGELPAGHLLCLLGVAKKF